MLPIENPPMLPRPPSPAGVIDWSRQMVAQLGRYFGQVGHRLNGSLVKDGSEPMTGPLGLKEYTVATLPTASDYEGHLIYVSDGGAGAVFRGSDGSSWVSLG